MYLDGQGLFAVSVRGVLIRQWRANSVLEVAGSFLGL